MTNAWRRLRLWWLQRQLDHKTRKIDAVLSGLPDVWVPPRIQTVTHAPLRWIGRRWRYSWLWMRWVPLTLPEDDRVIYLSEPHEPWTPGQRSMAKGVETVHREIEPWLDEHGVRT